MKRLIIEYFTFNKSDRNGIIVLLFLILAATFILSVLNLFISPKINDYSRFYELQLPESKTKKWASKNHEVNSENNVINSNFSDKKNTEIYFNFNPNKTQNEDWKKLGLSPKLISTIHNFISKGGIFKYKDDLKKIYGLSESQFNKLKPYIQLPEKNSQQNQYNYPQLASNQKFQKTKLLEINSADSSQLIQLKGIGNVLARRILKYRSKLGGFISLNQLSEVWGLDSVHLNQLLLQIEIDSTLIKKIALNKCNVADLKKHPYIPYNTAVNIVLYRDRHGLYSKIEDLKKAVLVNEELFRKIAPYFSIE